MSESVILQKILLGIGALNGFRFWRNNSGLAWGGRPIHLKPGQRYVAEHGDLLLKNGHPIKLAQPGAADIIGIGAPDGRFVAFEVKTDDPRSVQTPEQISFQAMIEKHGGFYAVVRSKEEALAILKNLANNTGQNQQ